MAHFPVPQIKYMHSYLSGIEKENMVRSGKWINQIAQPCFPMHTALTRDWLAWIICAAVALLAQHHAPGPIARRDDSVCRILVMIA